VEQSKKRCALVEDLEDDLVKQKDTEINYLKSELKQIKFDLEAEKSQTQSIIKQSAFCKDSAGNNTNNVRANVNLIFQILLLLLFFFFSCLFYFSIHKKLNLIFLKI